MELPPFNKDDFDKYRDKNYIVKECDMDENMKKEASEHVATGIEKNTVQGEIDEKLAAKFIKE